MTSAGGRNFLNVSKIARLRRGTRRAPWVATAWPNLFAFSPEEQRRLERDVGVHVVWRLVRGWWLIATSGPRTRIGRLQAPNVEAVKVLDLAFGARPLATAKVELHLHFLALVEAIEVAAAIAGELEEHLLWVLAVFNFENELALAEALGDLLGVKNLVQLACDFDCHGRRIEPPYDIGQQRITRTWLSDALGIDNGTRMKVWARLQKPAKALVLRRIRGRILARNRLGQNVRLQNHELKSQLLVNAPVRKLCKGGLVERTRFQELRDHLGLVIGNRHGRIEEVHSGLHDEKRFTAMMWQKLGRVGGLNFSLELLAKVGCGHG